MAYIVIYKKILHGEKTITKGMLLWLIVFVCYLFVVAGATLLDRGGFWENGKIQPLFYSYKEAWNSFELVDWRNNILNILLFVPLGFLLPLGMKFFRKFWKTYLAGFLLTTLIETLQILLRRGIFELDDIFNNTVGAMIGYGCFALAMLIVSIIKRKPKSIRETLALQLPFLLVLASFVTLFIIYSNQELGNMSISYISKSG
jgi:glycopeptide antibiotics resistance protein